jgi:hypothetical protein
MLGLHWNGPLNAPVILPVGLPHANDFAKQTVLLNEY